MRVVELRDSRNRRLSTWRYHVVVLQFGPSDGRDELTQRLERWTTALCSSNAFERHEASDATFIVNRDAWDHGVDGGGYF